MFNLKYVFLEHPVAPLSLPLSPQRQFYCIEMEIKMPTLQGPMTDCYGTFEKS